MKDGNVVTLAQARRQKKFPAIAQIEAYWHGLRNGRLMPARSDFDPRGIGDNLSYALSLERIAPGHARIRLAGQHLNDILSMEVRGMPMSAFFTPAARDEIHEALEAAFDMPAEVNLTLRTEKRHGRVQLDAQMILLPMKDDQGNVARVLGGLQVDGPLGKGTQRFDIRSLDIRPIQVRPQNAADVENQTGLKRPGYWDMRGAPQKNKDVSCVDIHPTRSDQATKSEGHIMRPSGQAGTRVPGLAELAESFHGAPTSRSSGNNTRPGGHLRLVPRD